MSLPGGGGALALTSCPSELGDAGLNTVFGQGLQLG